MTQALSSDRFEVLREARTGLDPSRRMLWDTVVSAAAEGSRGAREWTPAEVMGAMSGLPAAKAGARETMEMFSPGAGRGIRTPTALTSLQGCWSWTATAPCDQKDCRDSLEGDDETCGILLDCGEATRTVSEAVLAEMARECPTDSVPLSARGPKFKNARSEEKELIRAAWNYLLLNLDIVQWAICRVTGEVQDSRSIALMRRLVGEWPYRVTVRVYNIEGDMFGLYGTGQIGIPRKGYYNDNLVAWTHGTHARRQCAAMDLAATLLHELMHLSGYTYIDIQPKRHCYDVYLADNLFRWALFHRYPGATTSGYYCGCGSLSGDNLVGCNVGIGIWSVDGPGGSACDDAVGGGVSGGSAAWLWDALRWLFTESLAFITRAALGLLAKILGALGKIVTWFGGLFDGLGSGLGGGGGCGCACQPCYDHCPDLWVDRGAGCELRDSDNREAVVRCLQDCIMQHDPAEVAGVGGEDDEDGQGNSGWEPW